MDRFPGYESLLSRIEHKKAQVKSQLPIEHCHLVDEFAVFVLDQFNKCLDDVPSSAQDDDHFGTDGTVTRAPTSDIQIDNQQINQKSAPSTAANNHNREATSGSISSEQTVSPISLPSPVTQSTIPANIEVKVEDGQSIQLGEFVKKEEDDGGEYVIECDCGECEICRVKREMKEERDESGESEQMEDCVKQEIKEEFDESGCETELGRDSGLAIEGYTRVKQEEVESDGEGERPCKIQRIDRVLMNEPVGSPSRIVIADDDQTIENGEDPSAGDEQQVPAESFLKRIEPDELGNRFECDYQACGKRMKKKQDLIDHIRTHTGEKPFKCSVEGCDRAFVQNSKLKAHLNTHSGTRLFACTWPRCEARFGQKINLTVHLRTHTGERPFQCDQCDATFTCHSHLTTHLRTHTGSRPFVCTWPECGQAFTQSSHLKTHSSVHSNERKFVCDVRGCTKVYKHNCALLRHQKAKHN